MTLLRIIICVALTVTAVVALGESPGCIDQMSECPKWALHGECKKNPVWMKPNCPSACQLCGKVVKCVNLYKECAEWKERGECTSDDNRIWMFFNCPKTCGMCGIKFDG